MTSRRQFLQGSTAFGALAVMGSGVKAAEPMLASNGSWPSWRGPSRDSTMSEGSLPANFEGLTKLWSMSLDDSYSGPIVSGGRVFTTETIAKRDESLIAVNQQTGESIWKRDWPGAMAVPFFAKSNGDWIRSTPATDGNKIVVGGMRDVVACFDASTGDELWRIDFNSDHGVDLPSFGLVCSPIIDGGSVYIQAGGGVRKINLADGQLQWKAAEDSGGMYGGAFSSPIIGTLHGVRQLVAQTRTTLCGIDLESGKILWQQEIPSFRGMNILTPVLWNDMVFTSCYGGKAQLYRLSPNNSAQWGMEKVWESKAEAYMSSPVVVNDHLYMHLKNSRFSCTDLASGEEKWRTTPFGKYWSMVTDGKRIMALDERGELLMIDPDPAEFKLLDRRSVADEPAWAHLAVAGDQVFIRRQKGLDAYRLA